jgi:putative ABC transport system permease protein
MIGDFFSLSFKNLKHRGIRSWLTLLGILIGVAAVVSLISLGDALKLTIGNQFGIANTELITVQAGGMSNQGPPGSYVVNPLTTDDVEKIKKLGSVKRAVRRNIGNVQVEYNDKMSYSYLASIPDGDDREFIYDQIDENPVTGRFLKDSDSHKVFLGYSFYNQADFWGKEIIPGKTILLNGEEFEVMGILDKTGSFIFDGCVYMNQKDMTDL